MTEKRVDQFMIDPFHMCCDTMNKIFFGISGFWMIAVVVVVGITLVFLQKKQMADADELLVEKCAIAGGQIAKLRDGNGEFVCVKVIPINIWVNKTQGDRKK